MCKRYYLAYGSNLNIPQMRHRCPTAKVIGTAEIKDYELLFKGSKTGYYLTIESQKGAKVPVAVWEVKQGDEANLDVYEGAPRFYYKKDMQIKCRYLKSGKKERYADKMQISEIGQNENHLRICLYHARRPTAWNSVSLLRQHLP